MISNEKRIWAEQQDNVLKQLYEQQSMRNWSMISKRMSAEFGLPRKSAKQCKQRYYLIESGSIRIRYENHLCADSLKTQWTIQQQLMLIQFHNEIGNKWSLIAQKIPGKSDNCVKNHFYSKLRKVLRKLNAIIHMHFRRQFREININVIYKIVQATQELFRETPSCEPRVSVACREIQNKMLNLSMLKQQQFDSQQRVTIYRQVIREINGVGKLYKRKSKKIRNSSIQAPKAKARLKLDQNAQARFTRRMTQDNNLDQGYQSEESSAFEGAQEDDSRVGRPVSHQEYVQEQFQPSLMVVPAIKKNQIVVKDEQQGIRDMLQEEGLLLFDKEAAAKAKSEFKFSERSSFKSYSQNSDKQPHFFDDSDLEGAGGFFKRKRSNVFRNLGDPSQKSQGEGPAEFYFNY